MTANITDYKQPWETLRLVVLYRILLALALSTFYFFNLKPSFVDSNFAQLFTVVSLMYCFVAIILFFLWLFKFPQFFTQVFWQLVLDVIFINLIIFSTGKSGLGLTALLIIPVAISAYLLSQNYAFFIAAIASITLSVFTYSYYSESDYFSIAYTQHSIIGALLFALALVFSRTAERSRKTQVKAEQQAVELENLELINQKVLNTLTSGVLIIDKNFQIKHANQAAVDYLDFSNDIKEQQLGEKLHQELSKWIQSQFNTSIIFQENISQPKLRAKFEPFSDSWIMIVLDKVSVINEELQHLKLSSLGKLTASIAHEIRNPLSSINQAAQLLDESSNIEESEKKLTSIITNNIQRMNLMVEKIMQLSKKRQFQPSDINLAEFIQHFVYEFCLVEPLEENQFNIDVASSIDTILFDETHLNQILWNLVANSIRHSGLSHDQVQCSIKFEEQYNNHSLKYCDNGLGISDDMAESLFEPFYTTQSEGTGLGLYICKELCDVNQSEINYIKTETGCCFKINL